MQAIQEFTAEITDNVERVIIGKREVVELALVALLCEGHILLEDVPGVGKTMLARALAVSLGLAFKRLQCTPDLLPNDVTGVSIFDQQSRQFTFIPGPAFTNILLADEINRATPRTQSALLEAMGERQVTVDGVTRPLPRPFFVMATQNPIEYEGTFPLPEAQLDRFFMRISIGYPTAEEEIDILERHTSGAKPMEELKPICSSSDIIKLQQQVDTVYTSREVRAYVSNIAAASRKNGALQLGVSTRAAISLLRASQARALMLGRDYVSPDDVQSMAEPVLAHRLVLSPEARMRNMTAERVLSNVIGSVQVPVKAR